MQELYCSHNFSFCNVGGCAETFFIPPLSEILHCHNQIIIPTQTENFPGGDPYQNLNVLLNAIKGSAMPNA